MSSDKLDRVACFIDGFNLFHAIRDMKQDHLKWVDLWKLMSLFVDSSRQELSQIYYFTALATWRVEAAKRHRIYIRALESVGVTTIKGKFKAKHRYCPSCKTSPLAHEEKESDVNIAIWMLDCAYRDTFDCAFLLSGDSDLAPPIRMIRKRFPQKTVKIIAPPERRFGKELFQATNARAAKIKKVHLRRALLPAQLTDARGLEIIRPQKFDPPEDPS